MSEIKDVKFGTTQVNKIYSGTVLVFEKTVDTIAPITTPRPIGGTYTTAQTVYLDVNEPCNTYFTIDGSIPTTASTKYIGDGIYLDADTTLKFFSVDTAGNAETVKTEIYDINITAGWRYVRFIGYGDSEFPSTTRLVELQAKNAAGTNFLLNKLPISGEAPNTGGGIEASTDGLINHASGTYPIWWVGEGIPTLTYDLGAAQTLETILVVGFSTVNAPRATRFIILVSTDNVSYSTVVNYSANNTIQPESGFEFVV